MNNQLKEALILATRYCSASEKCIADVEKKLMDWEIDTEIHAEVIDYLLHEKYIDEERYTRSFVNDKFKFNHWGRIKIRHHLKQKHISDNLINNAFDDAIDEETYKEVMLQLIEKKAKRVNANSEYERKVKIVQYLQSRGFEPYITFDLLGGEE